MTLVSNDPSWWPFINASLVYSYFIVAASVGVMYDWVLTFGQEIELIWRQRWSSMTFLYLTVRYVGIGSVVINMLTYVPTISVTDAGCLVVNDVVNWMIEVVDVALGVIMIARLYAMYQRSRKVLVFLVIIFLVVRIINAVIVTLVTMNLTGEEYVLSGTYQCMTSSVGISPFLPTMTWILGTVWEVLILCLAVWIAVKHFRELRQHSTSGIVGDCFAVLMKSHNTDSLEGQAYLGLAQILQVVQMFVLGPRLILGIREYHAELVDNSDTATAMTSIAFQERIHVSTSSSV
ncbi:hypothetical protein BD769DRAFT_1384724 [Suillus cothurnatus]|nr:hypothetical protein BD769DRAFT_1384724 [Suillus cothurnatus]